MMRNHCIPKRGVRRADPLQVDLSELFYNTDNGYRGEVEGTESGNERVRAAVECYEPRTEAGGV